MTLDKLYKTLNRQIKNIIQPCSVSPIYDYQGFVDIDKALHTTNLQRRNINFDISNTYDEVKKYLSANYPGIKEKVDRNLINFPNKLHPKFMLPIFKQDFDVPGYIIEEFNNKKTSNSIFEKIIKEYNLGNIDQLGKYTGPRSYCFFNQVHALERALLKYVIDFLKINGFTLINVPSLIHSSYIERCGFSLNSIRDQIYFVNGGHFQGLGLAGTSEILLAALFSQMIISKKDLPFKVCALSRCYRAETTTNKKEHGLYRVNCFDKVEMFAITEGGSSTDHSENMLHAFVDVQKKLFSQLGLHARILEMAPHELGVPAYHKYDVEAWMPGRKIYGEISSTSNCTDFQARRLGMRYTNEDGASTSFAHTVNGTACAIPRMLIALFETHYDETKHSLYVPEVLRPFLKNSKSYEDPYLKLEPVGPRWYQIPLKAKL